MNISSNMPLHIVLAEWALYQENKPRATSDRFLTELETLRLADIIERIESSMTPTLTTRLAKRLLLSFYRKEKQALERLKEMGFEELTVGIVRHP